MKPHVTVTASAPAAAKDMKVKKGAEAARLDEPAFVLKYHNLVLASLNRIPPRFPRPTCALSENAVRLMAANRVVKRVA